ncbi:hypothetical protein Glove_382g46 [Diversispora epigaea]|uniref:SAP domain-containing protein n=1 Tax=Diversispora epigaea TaxID=1348612 RepID=A0A397HBV3_9GLOM|nr:hypothetical protein Glove_382g46 [Diversispora epigaea]
MYAQRNPASDTLLTQTFHPSSAEDHFTTQNFLEEQQQQQQQQYNQEQLDEIQEQLNSSNMVQRFQISEANNFAFQTFGNNILGNSLPADWQQQLYSNDEMCGLVNDTNFPTNVFVDDLMSSNFVDEGSSWILDQNTEPLQLNQQDEIQQVHTPLSNSSSDTDSDQNNESDLNEQNRAQTPGPLQKSNIPNYLTIRRRSLSADNIHALAKSQQITANRKMIYPIQQHSEQISFDRTRSPISPAIRFEPQLQFLKQEACISQNIQIENQPNNINNDNNDNDRNNNRRQNSRTSSPSPQTVHATRPHLSRSISHQQIGPINHAQKLSELQARFKVKLDKRTQRSMPNIQLAAVAHGAMLQSNVTTPQKTNQNGGSGGVPIMDISSSSLSTPSTPTFPNEKPPNVAKQTLNPPRRGHTRKRSLSAPTTPFPNLTHHLPGSVPLKPAQSFPLNFSMASYARRPIQIQRNPKHSHATTIMSSEEYQRKLDEELEKVDFEDITVSELKEMLRQRGKPATGKKAVLMQRLQEEVEFVKAMKNTNNQLKNNNNSQFNQMISTPTSPSGVSLQSRIANLHISSPPMHSRRFSPYGSVSIPGSPRMMPSGLGNGRTGFNGNNVAYPEGDEWQFHSVGIQPLMPHNIEDATVQSHSIMMMGQATTQQQQQQQQQEMFGQQQPSSAPPTTTEFDQAFQQPPSSAPPMTTEFVDAYDFINPINLMSIGPDMMRLSVSDAEDTQSVLLKQESDNENKVERQTNGSLLPNETVTGILTQQALGFDFNSHQQLQDEHMMLKSDDFLNYTSVAPQHLPMQLELQQDGMGFSRW